MTAAETTAAIREQLAAEERALSTQVVYKGYTHGALKAAIDAVTDPADWRGPIAATMPGEAVLLAVAAIEFFTATTPSVSLDVRTMRYLVESEGYRAGQAGDH